MPIIVKNYATTKTVTVDGNIYTSGSTISVKVNDKEKEYMIVGPQEADPLIGKISNESPLGSAFLGKEKGDKIKVQTPAGEVEYKIILIKN
jgi:transcription elongation factor GreA